MVYPLTSQEFRDYAFNRLVNPIVPGKSLVLLNTRKTGESGLLLFCDSRNDINSLLLTFGYLSESLRDRAEIMLQPNRPGLDERDLSRFLEQLVANDRIFAEGFPLCPRVDELRKSLSLAKRSFERINDSSSGKVACYVKSAHQSTNQVKGLLYDYLVRPALFYLFRMGDFSRL